ncbi:50S ribosomal protein L16 [Candidatus Aerophobetes bacterium]|uniref:Large ribosomal subunit protein uL16 n=1 Tax=Aerophobetes bacterium TaxID=2030807 RepID=A0A7V0MZM9_UNCAE|nr:50S ribosomal protein L16 [Candidatus Aerophobetes bacterium]HDN84508.1 50S ribosomal protein L16 [Candidatus Aerophobetes bacterium]
MPLQPKRVKYRKAQRGRIKGIATSGDELSFGEYGLVAEEGGWITARQIEAARVTIVRSLKHEGRLWIRIFPDKPITKKPLETRMGKGKGEPAFWVAVVRPGRVLFEIGGIGEAKAREALTLASHKLPISVRFVSAKEVMV